MLEYDQVPGRAVRGSDRDSAATAFGASATRPRVAAAGLGEQRADREPAGGREGGEIGGDACGEFQALLRGQLKDHGRDEGLGDAARAYVIGAGEAGAGGGEVACGALGCQERRRRGLASRHEQRKSVVRRCLRDRRAARGEAQDGHGQRYGQECPERGQRRSLSAARATIVGRSCACRVGVTRRAEWWSSDGTMKALSGRVARGDACRRRSGRARPVKTRALVRIRPVGTPRRRR